MRYDHLLSLTDARGVFEHCSGLEPLPEHGYCVDDVARALIVAERGLVQEPRLARVADTCTDFLADALHDSGRVRNRCDVSGTWSGPYDTCDHWGRALWAWGTVLATSEDDRRIAIAEDAWNGAARQRSPFLRSLCLAALGAGEVLRVRPGDPLALALLRDTAERIPDTSPVQWPWPEPRLTYANAVIAHAVLLAGHHLSDTALMRRGESMLEWLVALQRRGNHLSVIPHTGWGPGELLPDFDQQPIEVATLVEACHAAGEITGDRRWADVVLSGAAWFLGDNDTGVAMADARVGAGFDGLTWSGRNPNCGAESTLAFLSVMQRAGQLSAYSA